MIILPPFQTQAVTGIARLRRALSFCYMLLMPTYIGGGFARPCLAAEPSAFLLRTNALVSADGVFLSQVVTDARKDLPVIRLANAPAFGQALTLTREKIQETLRQSTSDPISTNWSGAERVRVTRRARTLEDAEVNQLLTAALQKELARDKGAVELRFTRPWTAATIADDSFALNFIDLPASGLSPNMTLRFELRHGRELLGSWQTSVQVRLWRDVWIAQSALKRGEILSEASLTRERRDVLALRDTLGTLPVNATLEMTEGLQEGAPLLARSVRVRPVIRRGDLIEALLRDGPLQVSLRVEVLEDGVPGQIIRVRNPQSKREFRGKVQNEQSILIAL